MTEAKRLSEPQLEFLFSMALEVEQPAHVGATPLGRRRSVGVKSGSFEGPDLRGYVVAGNDWIVVRKDGVLVQDVRLDLETDDGHLLLMSYRGMRHGPPEVMERVEAGKDVDPSEYYFRTTPVFEAPEGRYDWLNKLIAVGVGWKITGGVRYAIYGIT